MSRRFLLPAVVIVSQCFVSPLKFAWADVPAVPVNAKPILLADADEKKLPDMEKHEDKDHEQEDEDKPNKHEEEKEIEQAVPMNMVPAAILDAVKKEVPDGTITEAELVAKKHSIMYSFDVKTPTAAYDVKITVDGKFYSKKIDNDEKDEKEEKSAKPEKHEVEKD